MKHLGDITKIRGDEAPFVDCIIGGSPCQDLSVAGKRAGLAGARSGLFMEQMRIIKEMREHDQRNGRTAQYIRPRYMVWENVAGAFTSGSPKGSDFAAVIEEIIKVAEPDADLHIDVPEGGWTKAGCYYSETGEWSLAWRLHDAQFWGVPQRRKRIALVADFAGLSAPEILFERKGGTWGAEQGDKAGQETPGKIGESVKSTSRERGAVIGLDCYNQSTTGEVANAIRSKSQDTDHTPCVIEEGTTENWDGSQIAPTLSARNAGGGQRMPDKMNFNAVIQREFVYDARGNGDGEISPTITGDHQNSIFDYSAIAVEETHDVVRRLTPMECERLQGFPDGWTDIGEWTDSKGKKRKTLDSYRYKALGNSIALPFWHWLIKRISAQYSRTPTLASLFDGIGGFPLCWTRVNGVGSAVWASEIEEFCIAVTKKHFGDEESEGDIRQYL